LICSKIADAVMEGKTVWVSEEAEAVESTPAGVEEAVEILGSYSFQPEEIESGASPDEDHN